MTTRAISIEIDTNDDFRAAIAREIRDAKAAGKAFGDACSQDDVGALYVAAHRLSNESCGGWPYAFRAVLRNVQRPLSLEMRQAFLQVWIENKSLASNFEQHFLLLDGLRKLLPPYAGGPMTLYRGARWRERCGRAYGISWTTDEAIAADQFAAYRRISKGGSCVLATEAPAGAIIGTMYDVGDYFNEREYLVDRRMLGEVRVVRRFAQLEMRFKPPRLP